MFSPSEFFHFLQRPQYQSLERKYTNILVTALKIYLLTFLVIGLISAINLTILPVFLALPVNETFEVPTSLKEHLWIYFFLATVFAPVTEEIIFRLSLLFNPVNLALSVSTLISLIIHRFCNHLISIISFSLVFILIYALASTYKSSLISFWNKNFKYIFYSLPILFGLVHISNYKIIEASQYFIALILIFPQLAIGFILSFTRLYYKKGFLICIIFHVLMNMISVSISLLRYIPTGN